MKKVHLAAAIIGALVPGYFFFGFIQEHGFDLPAFVSALFVNGAAGGFSADLLISSLVFWAFMFQEPRADDEEAIAPSLHGEQARIEESMRGWRQEQPVLNEVRALLRNRLDMSGLDAAEQA